MTNYFTISELVISGTTVPLEIADSILQHHIVPMNYVREALDKPITASKNSGYRPVSYEIFVGRTGTSEHTFQNAWDYGIGAIDWTVVNRSKGDLSALCELILEYTNYVRVCMYKTFIHCDYKQNGRYQEGKKQLYKSGGDSQWKFLRYV